MQISGLKYGVVFALLGVILVSLGCSSRKNSSARPVSKDRDRMPIALVLKHRSDTTSANVASQVTHALDYAHIPYRTIDLALIGNEINIPSSVRLIYVTTDKVEQLKNREVERLVQYTAAGNELIITLPLYDPRFAYLMGLKPGADYTMNKHAEGFRFLDDVYPDFADQTFKAPASYVHSGFSRGNFSRHMKILAVAENDSNYPVITQRKVGAGRTIYFNTSTMSDKEYRGLLFSAGLRGLNGVPYPVANASTIFLDDFPAPLYDRKLPPIDTEYDTTHAEFVTKIWWPDMKQLADQYDITYTALLAFNYNANVIPPFDFNEWLSSRIRIDGKLQNGSVWLARDIKQSRHELGFHGYNHFSLWKDDWQNIDFMIASLQAAKKRWAIDNLGRNPVTYVPPTNYVDSLGLAALAKVFPSIRYMSSLYLGHVEDGGGREFGPDPLNPHFFDYPRITDGYYDHSNSRFAQHSLYLYTGIWTHFIHPDDVFAVLQRADDDFKSRNPLGLGWHSGPGHDFGLYELFKKRLDQTLATYPMTRFLPARQAGRVVEQWRATRSSYREEAGSLAVKLNKPELKIDVPGRGNYWFMYVNATNQLRMNRALKRAGIHWRSADLLDGSLYQFETQSDSLFLPDLRTTRSDTAMLARAMQKYHNFEQEELEEQEPPQLTPEEQFDQAVRALHKAPHSRQKQERAIQLSVETNHVSRAIPILEQRLLNGTSWHPEDINRLIKYYSWQEESDRAYRLLDRLWDQHHEQAVLDLKNMMVDEFGVPDDRFRERWLKRKLELHPHDSAVLAELVRLNQNEQNWAEKKQYLQRLVSLHPESDTLYAYTLQRSLWYAQPDSTLKMLQEVPDDAASQLKPLSGAIARLYAYEEKDYTRALMWADKSNEVPVRTQLEWLLEQRRYHTFMNRGKIYLHEHPSNDSLRVFIGRQLIFAGYPDEGYKTLYPVFQKGAAPESTRTMVHREIGYMSYEQQKDFYRSYPAFFSDSLQLALKQRYRKNEGVRGGTSASYSSDNFDNDKGSTGVFAEWGNRTSAVHRLEMDEAFVGSSPGVQSLADRLLHVGYSYKQFIDKGSGQFSLSGGIYAADIVRPEASAGAWYATDSTYTSATVTTRPVLTNTALGERIQQLKGSLYREDYWLDGLMQSGASLNGSYYSDQVFSYEALLRIYVQRPFSTATWQLRPVAEISYSDASTSYLSGFPYYTPDQLFVKGAGMQLRFRRPFRDPLLSAELEVLGKHDVQDGLYFTGSARFDLQSWRYWKLSLNAEISTSTVYRSNNVGFSLSYNFPRNLR